MQIVSNRTRSLSASGLEKPWIVLDAAGQSLGRLASVAAYRLIGKHRVDFTPNLDCGDCVVIINASEVRLTGKKWDNREYFSHTGFPGGQRRITPRRLFNQDPRRLIEHAVRGMLPSNSLGRQQYRRLHIYTDASHDHAAQHPQLITL